MHIQQAAYGSTFILSIVCILTGNLDTSTWPLPVNLALPFDQNSVLGWYAVYFIYLNMEFTYGSSMIPTTSIFVCACTYISAICEQFDFLIHSTSQDLRDPHRVNELHQKLCQSIDVHNRIYE